MTSRGERESAEKTFCLLRIYGIPNLEMVLTPTLLAMLFNHIPKEPIFLLFFLKQNIRLENEADDATKANKDVKLDCIVGFASLKKNRTDIAY